MDGAIAAILSGPGGVLFGDLAVHEHDLRGVVDVPDHGALEVDVMLPRTLAGFAKPLRQAGLGAIAVRHDDRIWRSHDSEPGWTLGPRRPRPPQHFERRGLETGQALRARDH